MKKKVALIKFALSLAALSLAAVLSGVNARAEEAAPANPYSGDIWTRSTLTGDWGGLRNDLAAKGVTLEWDPLESTCRHASLSIL